jgi:hypothetical protein
MEETLHRLNGTSPTTIPELLETKKPTKKKNDFSPYKI